jgi:hypothetical protein
MTPKRLAVKFFTSPDPAAPVDLGPCLGLFHRFIQQGGLEGLLIDVADYAHVPEGPGVVLIGHEVDYGLDLAGGRAGLLTTRKRYPLDLPLPEVLRDTLRKALLAVQAIERDGSTGLRFATGALEIQLVDRLAAPNQAQAYEAAKSEIAPVLAGLYGSARPEIRRAHAQDARQTLALAVEVGGAGAAEALLGRLPAAAG